MWLRDNYKSVIGRCLVAGCGLELMVAINGKTRMLNVKLKVCIWTMHGLSMDAFFERAIHGLFLALVLALAFCSLSRKS